MVIDPPFGSGADYVRKVRLRGDQKGHKSGSPGVVEQVQYQDTWEGDSYLQFMFEPAKHARLRNTGDPFELRLDLVFGKAS